MYAYALILLIPISVLQLPGELFCMKVHEHDWEVDPKSCQGIKQHFQNVERPLSNRNCHINKLCSSVSLISRVFWKIHIVLKLYYDIFRQEENKKINISLYKAIIYRRGRGEGGTGWKIQKTPFLSRPPSIKQKIFTTPYSIGELFQCPPPPPPNYNIQFNIITEFNILNLTLFEPASLPLRVVVINWEFGGVARHPMCHLSCQILL